MDKDIKYYVDIHFYFRVHDSWMFGGAGSVGYMSYDLNDCTDASDEMAKAACRCIAAGLATQFQVAPSKIESITKDEYDRRNEEDEEG